MGAIPIQKLISSPATSAFRINNFLESTMIANKFIGFQIRSKKAYHFTAPV
ncbi:hypothetical protein [Helicobacter rodentium]|uniref:hypothetical protein n=1 Tax=Helicobacter rodentium TaxID=59617 RepID=UPI0023F153DD|nr:hypothetical protein [Helicobacter rodentium]